MAVTHIHLFVGLTRCAVVAHHETFERARKKVLGYLIFRFELSHSLSHRAALDASDEERRAYIEQFGLDVADIDEDEYNISQLELAVGSFAEGFNSFTTTRDSLLREMEIE